MLHFLLLELLYEIFKLVIDNLIHSRRRNFERILGYVSETPGRASHLGLLVAEPIRERHLLARHNRADRLLKVGEVSADDLLLDSLELHLLLLFLLLLLRLDLLLYKSLLVFLQTRLLFLEIKVSVVVVARMLLLQDLGLKVKVVNGLIRALARLPVARQGSLEAFLRDEEQILVLLDVHAKEPSILLNLLQRRIVVIV